MNSEQRQNHLSKVQCVQVCDVKECSIPMMSSVPSSSPSKLSVAVGSAVGMVNIPLSCLQGIWDKAEQLITSANAITPAPGQEPEARMVLSYSGNMPHMVLPKKGEFCCDSKCSNWKAVGICSHTVAVAEVNHKLPQFLSHKKRKRGVNITKLVTTKRSGKERRGEYKDSLFQ